MSQFYPGWADEYGLKLAELDNGDRAKWPKRNLRYTQPAAAARAAKRAKGSAKGGEQARVASVLRDNG